MQLTNQRKRERTQKCFRGSMGCVGPRFGMRRFTESSRAVERDSGDSEQTKRERESRNNPKEYERVTHNQARLLGRQTGRTMCNPLMCNITLEPNCNGKRSSLDLDRPEQAHRSRAHQVQPTNPLMQHAWGR